MPLKGPTHETGISEVDTSGANAEVEHGNVRGLTSLQVRPTIDVRDATSVRSGLATMAISSTPRERTRGVDSPTKSVPQSKLFLQHKELSRVPLQPV